MAPKISDALAESGRKATGAAHPTCQLALERRGEAKAADTAARRLRA